MSLRTIGYTPEGRPIKEDLGPSYARVPGHSGSLVVAPSRRGQPVDRSWTELGDKSLEAARQEPPESGCQAKILEVPTVSVTT